MTKKTTKRALIVSIFAMLLCFTMMLSTTYAWFTDSVTSSGNIIKTGTLDVEMEWKDATASGTQQTYKDASEGAIFNYKNWEPGYVDVKNIKISNVGTLDFKYQLAIVPNGELSSLTDAIDVYYAEGEYTITDRALTNLTKLGTLTEVLANMSNTANGELKAGKDTVVTIALKMQETAGNEYQDLSIGTDFAVKLYASQLTSETDDIDDQYDAMATIDSEAELLAALAADYDLITLGANVDVTSSIVIPADKVVTIDLNGYSISQVNGQQTTAYAMIDNQGTLTVKDSIGTGKISYTDTTPYTSDPGWASNTIKNTGTLTINGGTVENLTPDEVMNFGYPHAIDAYQGSVTTINGGMVKSLNYDCIRMFCNSETEATKVVITGGTIFNRVSFQDPQATRAGYGILEINGGNFVSTDGVSANVRLLNFCQNCSNMKATVTGGTFDKGFKTQDIGGSGIKTSDWLTMGTGVAVTTQAELQAALANGGNVVLASNIDLTGTITVPAGATAVLDMNGMTIAGTLSGTGNQDLFLVKGNLTVNNGTITLVATQNQGWGAMSAIFDITAGGAVTLDNVVAENKGGTDMNFVAHLNNWGTATLNVNNSTLKATYVAVRVFNSGYDMNTVVIKDSTLATTGNAAFWVHNYTAADFGTQDKANAQAQLLDFTFDNVTFVAKKAAFRYGMTNAEYYAADGVTAIQ